MDTIRKLVSISVIFAFLAGAVSFALTEEELLSMNAPQASTEEKFVLTANTIGVPKDFGAVKDKFIGKDPRFVIHIQDAHTNYEAQTNISNILESLYKEYKIDFISLEGADGVIDTTWFKAFPDAEIRREVADYFMKKGEITGAEFLSITTDYPITLFGAETRDLYIKNLKAFTSSYPLKGVIEKYFLGIRGILNKLKNYIYSKTLIEIDSRITDYKEKRLSLSDYARFLDKLAKQNRIPLHDYPDFGKLVYTLQYEEKIDFKIVDQERSALIDTLSKSLSKDSLSDLVLQSFSFKTGRISSAEYYEYLKNLSEQNGINLQEQYPNLHYYTIYTRLYEKINNEMLFKEIDGLKEEIKKKYFVNDDQEMLNRLSLNIGILLDLVNIRLSNLDYEYYKAHKEDFDPNRFLGFIHKQVLKYNLSYDLEDAYVITLENMPKLEEFYEMALVRDRALVDNTLKGMDEGGKRIAVLVTGGFHTEGITKLLKEKGVSYAVVTPSITKEAESLYIQVLTGQRMTFEDIMFEASPVGEEKQFLVPLPATFGRMIGRADVILIGGVELWDRVLATINEWIMRHYDRFSDGVRVKAEEMGFYGLSEEEVDTIYARSVAATAGALNAPEAADDILRRFGVLVQLERLRERALVLTETEKGEIIRDIAGLDNAQLFSLARRIFSIVDLLRKEGIVLSTMFTPEYLGGMNTILGEIPESPPALESYVNTHRDALQGFLAEAFTTYTPSGIASARVPEDMRTSPIVSMPSESRYAEYVRGLSEGELIEESGPILDFPYAVRPRLPADIEQQLRRGEIPSGRTALVRGFLIDAYRTLHPGYTSREYLREELKRIPELPQARQDMARARMALVPQEARELVETVLNPQAPKIGIINAIVGLPPAAVIPAIERLEALSPVPNINIKMAVSLLKIINLLPAELREIIIRGITENRPPQAFLAELERLNPAVRFQVLSRLMLPEFPVEVRTAALRANLLTEFYAENPNIINILESAESKEAMEREIEQAMAQVEERRGRDAREFLASAMLIRLAEPARVTALAGKIMAEDITEAEIIEAALDVNAEDLERAIDITRRLSYTTNEKIVRNVLTANEVLTQLRQAAPEAREALREVISRVAGPYALPEVIQALPEDIPATQRIELINSLTALTSPVFPEEVVYKTRNVQQDLIPDVTGAPAALVEAVIKGEGVEEAVTAVPAEEAPSALRQLARSGQRLPSESELRVTELETFLLTPSMAPPAGEITAATAERFVREEIGKWNATDRPKQPPIDFVKQRLEYLTQRLWTETGLLVDLSTEGGRYTEAAGAVLFDGFEVARIEEGSILEGVALEKAMAALVERPALEVRAALAPPIGIGIGEERIARPAAAAASEEEIVAWMKRIAALESAAYMINRDEIRDPEAPVMVFEPAQIRPYSVADEKDKAYMEEMKMLERERYVTFVRYRNVNDILENLTAGVPFTIIGFREWFEKELVPVLRETAATDSRAERVLKEGRLLPVAMLDRTPTGFKEYGSLSEITGAIHPPMYRGVRVAAILLAKFTDKDVTENTPIYRQLQLLLAAMSGLRYEQLRDFIGLFLGPAAETNENAFSRISIILNNILIGRPPEPFGRRAREEYEAAQPIQWSL